jgi:hypothetical protein
MNNKNLIKIMDVSHFLKDCKRKGLTIASNFLSAKEKKLEKHTFSLQLAQAILEKSNRILLENPNKINNGRKI